MNKRQGLGAKVLDASSHRVAAKAHLHLAREVWFYAEAVNRGAKHQ